MQRNQKRRATNRKKSSKPSKKVEKDIVARSSTLLCFSDIMDNISDFRELDLVPKSYIQMIKEDKTKIATIIEYSTSEVAVIDNVLLICHESLEMYYKTCQDLLIDFREKVQGVYSFRKKNPKSDYLPRNLVSAVNKKFRKRFLRKLGHEGFWEESPFEGDESPALGLVKSLGTYESVEKGLLEEYGLNAMYLKMAELASKIMLCFNGENSMAYNVRIDLLMLGYLKDFIGELKLTQLSLKKFRKAYMGWFYRRVIMGVCFEAKLQGIRTKFAQKASISSKTFSGLTQIWEEEYERVIQASKQKKRSYKLWEYLSLLQLKFIRGLNWLRKSHRGTEEAGTELEIFLIEKSLDYYEKAKKLCSEDIHNNCAFEYLSLLLRLLFELEIDVFMAEEDFYKRFVDDHKEWVSNLVKYHEKMVEFDKEENEKWRGLTLVDYSKLVTLRAHLAVVEDWDGFLKFYRQQEALRKMLN